MVAIDYTGSNGEQKNPKSLHYLNPKFPNEYERAILACGEILEQYDTDCLFPVWGFGANIKKGTSVNHCFPINGNNQNPCV